jgi:hypothetical protein
MEPTLNRSKPWMLPFWFMAAILIVTLLQNLFLYRTIVKYGSGVPGNVLFFLLMWPVILLIETVVYWWLRKRIAQRRWVWAHLLFSLLAFILVRLLQVIVLFWAQLNYLNTSYDSFYPLINKIEIYCFWGSVAVGHIFFIIAIVRSFSYKNAVASSQEANDFLNEL